MTLIQVSYGVPVGFRPAGGGEYDPVMQLYMYPQMAFPVMHTQMGQSSDVMQVAYEVPMTFRPVAGGGYDPAVQPFVYPQMVHPAINGYPGNHHLESVVPNMLMGEVVELEQTTADTKAQDDVTGVGGCVELGHALERDGGAAADSKEAPHLQPEESDQRSTTAIAAADHANNTADHDGKH